MPTYFRLDANNTMALLGLGTVHKFQTSTLEADHPPIGDSSNKVATTGWIQSLLSGNPMGPTVSDAGGLNITVNDGVVNTPTSGVCNIAISSITIGVNKNSLEYIWVRYSDCQVVASTTAPTALDGTVIAEVLTDATHILSIHNYLGVGGWATLNSPFFSGDPQVPDPPPGDNDNSIANTRWVQSELLTYAPIDSPTFTGNPQAPSPPPSDNSQSIATTEWVNQAFYGLLLGGNAPQLSFTPPSLLQWSTGSVSIGSGIYGVNAGTYTFPSSANGMYSVVAIPTGTSTTIVSVVPVGTAISSSYAPLGMVSVVAGVITSIGLPSLEQWIKDIIKGQLKVGYGGRLIEV